MLGATGIVTAEEAQEIARGLDKIMAEIEAGTFTFSRALEDIHLNVESRLTRADRAGRRQAAHRALAQRPGGDRLQALCQGRDRRDRRRARRAPARARDQGARACRSGDAGLHPSPDRAADHLRPSSARLCRDAGQRPRPLRRRGQAAGRMPARRGGACRHALPHRPGGDGASALGFAQARGELARRGVGSRLRARGAGGCVDLPPCICRGSPRRSCNWTSPQWGFARLSDKFTTGSSIMPQKRNPDAAELVRAKTGRIAGAFQALLMVMKGLPLAYAKDMQEDKEPVFDALDALKLGIAAMTGMVADLEPDVKAMKRAASAGPFDRDRPRRLAGAQSRAPLPGGAPCHRQDRGLGRIKGLRSQKTAAFRA